MNLSPFKPNTESNANVEKFYKSTNVHDTNFKRDRETDGRTDGR